MCARDAFNTLQQCSSYFRHQEHHNHTIKHMFKKRRGQSILKGLFNNKGKGLRLFTISNNLEVGIGVTVIPTTKKKSQFLCTTIPQNGFSSIRYIAFQWKHNISKELSKTYHLSFINNFNQKKKRKKRVNLNIYSKKPNEQWWKHQIPLSCLSCGL